MGKTLEPTNSNTQVEPAPSPHLTDNVVAHAHGQGSESSHDPLLKPRAAALYLGLTVDWLATMRGTDKGPQYVRVGERSCVYRKSALDAWIAARAGNKSTTVAPTTLPDRS